MDGTAMDGFVTESRATAITAIATVIMAAATIVMVVVAGLQLCALNRTDETQRIASRANIVVVPGNVYNVSDGKIPEPRTVIGNSGKTYSREVKRWIGVTLKTPLSTEQETSLGRGDPVEGTAVLSPGSANDVIISYGQKLNGGDQEDIKRKTYRLYVFGRIEYLDMFDKKHWI